MAPALAFKQSVALRDGRDTDSIRKIATRIDAPTRELTHLKRATAWMHVRGEQRPRRIPPRKRTVAPFDSRSSM
jgi:hypothetical protein